MAIVRAVKSGNWSDTTVWNTGALPTSADDVYSNTFTVTIDTSPTVLSISNAAATGVTAGGSFVATNGITLTCGGAGLVGGGAALFSSNLTTGQSCSIVGNVTGGTSTGFFGANNISTGTLNITGNVTGGAGTSAYGANNNSTGTLNITGNVTGGAGGNAYGANNNSTGILVHIGVVQASTTAGIGSASNQGTTILTGPFLTTANGVNPVFALRWFWQNTTPPATYYQIRSANLAVIRPLYTADSVGGNPAVTNVRSGTVYGPNNELTGTCAVPGASSVLSGVPVDATTGTVTITAADIRAAVGLASANLDTQLAAKPTAAQVRSEMDSNSTKLANLDATVSSRSTYAGGDTSGTTTLLGRLTSARASGLDNLDASVSSRLATSGYTTPPTTAAIAAAVWANATRTLTAAVYSASDVASAVWAAVTRTITGGTVDTLVNSPDVPTEAEIADAVRTELATELDRIDVATSTRLAPADTLARVTLVDTTTTLTNAPDVPTPEEIAAEVRSELTPELERVANTATTQEVAEIVEGAWNQG